MGGILGCGGGRGESKGGKESGVGSQESGVRSQESGVRSQESGFLRDFAGGEVFLFAEGFLRFVFGMYIPAANRIEDPEKIFAFIEEFGFATVVTEKEGVPWGSHLPVLLDAGEGEGVSGRLRSHMARANEQWRHFARDREVLCVFHGPHAYISPSAYVSEVAVPTWNYAAVHVYGYPEVREDAEFLRRVVDDTTDKYEKDLANPWRMDLPEATVDSLLRAIVGFSITISRIEAKFKLGQNRSAEDQASMLVSLEGSEDLGAKALAEFMKAQGNL